MATVLERPMSVLSDAQSPQLIPQRRHRDSVEVIDVDSLDDDLYQDHRAPSPGPSRPAQRRRVSTPSEIISLLDSDEDEPILSASTSIRPASRTRLQSPPPPNQPWIYVPPVPPVPTRYASDTSFPMRRQAPPFPSPPVVRPSDQPFPFEANMRQQTPNVGPSDHTSRLYRDARVIPPRPLQAAPPSHHIPAMGLGGALIAHNRERHRLHQAFAEGSSFLGRVGATVGSGVRRILGGPAAAPRNALNILALGNNFGFLDEIDDDPDRMVALQLFVEDGEGLRDLDPTFNPARAYVHDEFQRRRNPERPPYYSEYTHPHPPEAGFTYDFAPKPSPEVIDVTSPIVKEKKIPILEPIIINDSDDSAISHTATATSITQSLSSHVSPSSHASSPNNTTALVCARCLTPLILSNNLTSEEHRHRRVWGLRCGHLIDGKCLQEIGQPQNEAEPDTSIDKKGKAKATATAENRNVDDNTRVELAPVPGYGSEPDIRSRLRPRHLTGVHTPSSSSSSSSSLGPIAPAQRRRGIHARKQPPAPPQEYMWYCPVSACGKVHVSVKVNGEWIPEREDEEQSEGYNPASSGRGRGRGGRGRARNRSSLGGLFGDGMGETSSSAGGGNEGARGAIPLFL